MKWIKTGDKKERPGASPPTEPSILGGSWWKGPDGTADFESKQEAPAAPTVETGWWKGPGSGSVIGKIKGREL